MTQIENLIVVEVPKRYRNITLHYSEKHDRHFTDGDVDNVVYQFTLPFPCSIIGLASEVKIIDIVHLLRAADYKYNDLLIANHYFNFLDQHSLTSPDKDYLFLKRKG